MAEPCAKKILSTGKPISTPVPVKNTQPPLRYPIILVHGFGYRDDKRFGYWGRIPQTLEQMGCQVFLSGQDGAGDIPHNGQFLRERIDWVIARTGAEKVNLIAHSKGGLDSRYAISVLGAGEKVASLTTLATPHYGSKTMDKLMDLPKPILGLASGFTNLCMRLLGDQNPRAGRVFWDFTTPYSRKFNESCPDHPGVYYQSYAFIMAKPGSDLFLWLPNRVVRKQEGENDGLLPPESVKWGNFRGTYRALDKRGVSHLDETDFRRKPLMLYRERRAVDILEFYREMVWQLGEMGF